MKRTIMLILTMLFAVQGLAFSETFFWEDKKSIHMTDDVSKLPPKFREKYEKFIKQQPKQEVNSAKMGKGVEKNQPVESFDLIVSTFSKFFESPQKIIYRQKYSDSPSGVLVFVNEYSAANLRYDIKKTDSMISPFTAHIELDVKERNNGSCGNVSGYKKIVGWHDEKEALEKSDSSSCYKTENEYSRPIKFVFAYQNSKWVLKSVVYSGDYSPERVISSALGLYPSAIDKESVVFNAKWMNLIK
jgi:hypothetical protein